ncbi:MAG: VOC family protein, partial [Acidimicrobiia bacterium]
DTDAALRFYDAAVGLGTEVVDMGTGPYTTWTVDGNTVGGTMPPPMEEVPTHWHIYFGAGDAAATVARAQELGGAVLNGPMDTPVGPMATIRDPQGGTFSIIELKEWPTD